MTPTAISIQLYKSAKDNTGEAITAQQAIEAISSGSLNAIVNNIRRNLHTVSELKAQLEKETDEENKKQLQQRIKEHQWTADEMKKSLPAVTWSGTFFKRLKESISQYSGLICIDIDKVPAIDELKKKLKADPYTWLIFTSPSGKGLKVIVRVAAGPEYHLQSFVALEEYYKKLHDVVIDPSGKDICRLCFLTTDTDFQCNYNSEIFDATKYQPSPPPPATSNQQPVTSKKEEKQLQTTTTAADVWKVTADYMDYTEGQRNQFIYKYACNCNRRGVDMADCEGYAHGQASDLKPKEITDSIRSAYTHNAAEWAAYAKKTKPHGTVKSTQRSNTNTAIPAAGPAGGAVHSPRNGKVVDKPAVAPAFWYETENRKTTDKEGNPLKQYNIYYSGLIDFLSHAGYYRLPLPNKSFEFIRYGNNVCDTVPLHSMRDHVMDWVQEQQADANQQQEPDKWTQYSKIREMLIRGSERYFNANKLSILPYKKIKFIKDTKESAFFFFKNCYVKVTADNIETRPLAELDNTLWQADIIDREFTREKIIYETNGKVDIKAMNCEFAKYMAFASSSPKKYSEVTPDIITERFYSHCSAVGYMLHGWKNKIGKAIIAVDHKVPEDKTEQNGGTGKSIYGESFKYVKSACIIDGREYKDDYPFRFERVGVDTKIVVMQDCRYTLDFGSFFVPITGDFTYNRRHTGYVTLPYDDSPKWWFDTNFTFKGDGASFRRRQHIIEFDDFFDENHTPYDEFGHLLFQDWDDVEWNKFYNHYFQCVQIFLAGGLIPYTQSNYDSRRLLVETPAEFIDFFDASEEKGGKLIYKIERNRWMVKKDLMKMWNDEATGMNMQKVTPHLFSKWFKKYCATKGLQPVKDKTNGVEYYMVATADYKGPVKYYQQKDLFTQ